MQATSSLRRIGAARLFFHLVVLIIVVIWLVPTLGIFVSALRDKDQITVSGWWTAFAGSSQMSAVRLAGGDKAQQDGANYVISGSVFGPGGGGTVRSFGTRVQAPSAYEAGT